MLQVDIFGEGIRKYWKDKTVILIHEIVKYLTPDLSNMTRFDIIDETGLSGQSKHLICDVFSVERIKTWTSKE